MMPPSIKKPASSGKFAPKKLCRQTAKQTEALNRRILELEQQKAAITAGINNSYLTWLYSYIVLNGIIPFVFLGIYIFIRWRGSKKLATAAVRMVKNA